jgi:hypothetical protein
MKRTLAARYGRRGCAAKLAGDAGERELAKRDDLTGC